MNDRNRALLHIICWMTFLFLPLFISYINGKPMDVAHFMQLLPNAAILAILFYINYFVLIDKLLFKKQLILFFLVNIVIIFAILALSHFVLVPPAKPMHGMTHHPPMHAFGEHLPGMMLHQGTTLVFCVVLCVAIRMTHNSYKKDIELQIFETERSQAELSNLKSQLNPHFLFNSLNNIYALAAFDSDKTQYAIHNLSDLLRYVLYESNQAMVPLQKEVSFVKSYTDLMRLRCSDNVTITEEYASCDKDDKVAPLLFIPLVENAFKHGIDAIDNSFINISFTVDNGFIICTIENSNFPKNEEDRSGHGIGIDNLKKRLEAIYPNKYEFETKLVEGKYRSYLKIPVKSKDETEI